VLHEKTVGNLLGHCRADVARKAVRGNATSPLTTTTAAATLGWAVDIGVVGSDLVGQRCLNNGGKARTTIQAHAA